MLLPLSVLLVLESLVCSSARSRTDDACCHHSDMAGMTKDGMDIFDVLCSNCMSKYVHVHCNKHCIII